MKKETKPSIEEAAAEYFDTEKNSYMGRIEIINMLKGFAQHWQEQLKQEPTPQPPTAEQFFNEHRRTYVYEHGDTSLSIIKMMHDYAKLKGIEPTPEGEITSIVKSEFYDLLSAYEGGVAPFDHLIDEDIDNRVNTVLELIEKAKREEREQHKVEVQKLIEKWEKEVKHNAISNTLKNCYISDLKALKEQLK